MGLTKQYLRWEASNMFGVIASPGINIILVRQNLVLVAACENVFLWDFKRQIAVKKFVSSDPGRVTRIAYGSNVVAGYNDGKIRLFDFASSECATILCGHKSDVTVLTFNKSNTLLVSGGKDTCLIVWDVLNHNGLYRLNGHTGIITQAKFLSNKNYLVTSSKDCLVKFWDLDIQHCFCTIVGHKSEVLDFVLLRKESVLCTGSLDSELRFYHLIFNEITKSADLESGLKQLEMDTDDKNLDESSQYDNNWIKVEKLGSVFSEASTKVEMMLNKPGNADSFYCLSQGSKSLFLYRMMTEKELSTHMKKKNKKAAKKSEDNEVDISLNFDSILFSETVLKEQLPKCASVIKTFDASLKDGSSLLCTGLQNGLLEYFSSAVETTHNLLSMPSHCSEVRALAISSDSTMICSCSKESVKVWSKSTLACLRTVKCGYALCCCMVPGNKHVVVGTKTGKLYIIDIGVSDVLEIIDAHLGEVWSLDQYPNGKGLISGGSDKCLKFWDYRLQPDDNEKLVLTLALSRKLDLEEDILSVKISENGKYFAVALLDNTVKVFFFDSMKFFLSMYGHKLPVVSVDISTDNSLLVSGSADRNMKIWGMDFGDCHKSIFAHEDSITCVKFLPKTHFIFSAGKDGLIKQWDADKFLLIQTLRGHFKCAVWTIAVAPAGANIMVSSAVDKSLRVWERTMEPLVLEEEQENEREREFEQDVDKNTDQPVIPGANEESGLPTRKNMETVKAAELIMETLELADQFDAGVKVPILVALGVSGQEHLLQSLTKVKSSELEQSLLVLPFTYVTQLFQYCQIFIEKGLQVELNTRIVLFLVRIHHGRIIANDELSMAIDKVSQSIQKQVTVFKDRIGFNIAAMQFLKQQIEKKEQVKLFADATSAFNEKKRKRQKRDKAKAILTVVS